MTCKCGSNRMFTFSSKSNDCNVCTYNYAPGLEIEKQGYLPRVGKLCGGDYIHMTICVDCGLVQNFQTVPHDEMLELFEV